MEQKVVEELQKNQKNFNYLDSKILLSLSLCSSSDQEKFCKKYLDSGRMSKDYVISAISGLESNSEPRYLPLLKDLKRRIESNGASIDEEEKSSVHLEKYIAKVKSEINPNFRAERNYLLHGGPKPESFLSFELNSSVIDSESLAQVQKFIANFKNDGGAPDTEDQNSQPPQTNLQDRSRMRGMHYVNMSSKPMPTTGLTDLSIFNTSSSSGEKTMQASLQIQPEEESQLEEPVVELENSGGELGEVLEEKGGGKCITM